MLEIRKYGRSYSRFEEILKEKSITPYRVATDLKFSPMLLSDWKNDKSKPKLDTMILIANYLNVPVTDFSDLESEVWAWTNYKYLIMKSLKEYGF